MTKDPPTPGRGSLVREILLRAATLIETRGWCRGAEIDAAGRVCAVGAIRMASPGAYILREDAHDAMDKAVGMHLYEWNDKQRSKRQVVQRIREVAATL